MSNYIPLSLKLDDSCDTISISAYNNTYDNNSSPTSITDFIKALKNENAKTINVYKIIGASDTPFLIDEKINNTQLTNIKDYFYEDDTGTSTYTNEYDYITRKYGLYELKKYYESLKNIFTNNITGSNYNPYNNLYNDKHGNNYYATAIYRGKKSDNAYIIGTNGVVATESTYNFIPIFTCDTKTDSVEFYLRARGFSIPLKKVKLSSHTEESYTHNHYIYIYPQYIIDTYKQYKENIADLYTPNVSDVYDSKIYGDISFIGTASEYQTLGNLQKIVY